MRVLSASALGEDCEVPVVGEGICVAEPCVGTGVELEPLLPAPFHVDDGAPEPLAEPVSLRVVLVSLVVVLVSLGIVECDGA